MNFDSITERDSAAALAQLGGKRCAHFGSHLPKTYLDADGVELVANPDFLIERPRCFTFVDTKSGKLNNHYSRTSSHEALKRAYADHFHRCGDHMSHSQLSTALYSYSNRGALAVLEGAFNHAVWKQVAVQAQHGWQRFLVVFKRAPTRLEAKRYLDAGLVFCTLKTLPDMINTIELSQHGFYVPFVFKGRGYSFTVTPDPTSRSLSAEAVQESDRAKFLAAVATDKAAVAARHATEATDTAAGILPF